MRDEQDTVHEVEMRALQHHIAAVPQTGRKFDPVSRSKSNYAAEQDKTVAGFEDGPVALEQLG